MYDSIIYIWGGFQNSNIKDILLLYIFWCEGTKVLAKGQVVVMDKMPALQPANSRKIHEIMKHLAAKSILKQLIKFHMTLSKAKRDNNFWQVIYKEMFILLFFFSLGGKKENNERSVLSTVFVNNPIFNTKFSFM